MRVLLVVAALLSVVAFAGVPNRLAYQGRLTKADGSPESGVVNVVFSIFDTSNAKLWSETQVLALTSGYYATVLGDLNPIPASAFDGSERELELTIGDTVLAPRQRINSVPYAMLAGAVSGGLPASPNLLSDTLTFASIPAGQSLLAADADWGYWKYVKNSCQNGSILVEEPPADLVTLIQPNTASATRAFKVLHLTFSPGSGSTGEGRLVQQAIASDKASSVTMSAYVKVISGQLFVGPEDKWQAQTASRWTRVAVTATPDRTLGGNFGFTYQPGVLTEAYVALPKVELAEAATPYVETAMTGPSIVDATCTPDWGMGNAAVGGITICSTNIALPWPAHLDAYVSGHIRSAGATRCTVAISINNDLSVQDMCCTATQAAFAPILIDTAGAAIGWVPAATHRQKVLPAGTYSVSYFLYSAGATGCGFNGSTMSVTATRL